ncbi:MAG: chalcone isomerase family protein [Desulforhopalus sp.]
MRILFFCFLVMVSQTSYANDIAGVTVGDTLQMGDGTKLHLNGAGIRSKFFLDIYIAQLYMEHPAGSAEEVIASPGKKRMIMHFLYKEVTKDKLVSGWNEGFGNNLEPEHLAALKDRLDTFNTFFRTVKKGDIILLDYIPEQGTVVTISGQEVGVIGGKDFNDALLGVWLGPKPINKGLKTKLLKPVQ